MNEMKEFYIAPEVQIICFAPVEYLADSNWDAYAINPASGTGSGTVPDGSPTVEGGFDGDINDGEEE